MPKPRCRTGCITCRIRRIKCDEAKPSCVRCSSTGRKCDGYLVERPEDELPTFGTHHHTFRPAILPSPRSAATDFELRAIQHFQRKTVPALAASFDSDFWDSVVLHISATELPVRSAIVAFSSLHECFEGSKDNSASSDGLGRTFQYGLKQYNYAVRRTAQLLDMNDQASCGIALISCLLFNCLELLQDNYPAAITHLTGGLQLLNFCQNIQKTKQLQPSLLSLNSRLRQIFGRMIVATMFLADTHYGAELVPDLFESEAATTFLTVAEARDSLDILFLSAYCFLRPLSKEDPSQISTARILQRSQLLNRLQNWYGLFQNFVDATKGSFTARDSTGAVLLEIHYLSLFIMLETAIDNSNILSSTPAPPFVRITSLVESLLVQPEPSDPSVDELPRCKLPRYSFDLGVIGPLFYTAVKCWDPFVRAKAVFLLRHPNIPRREGMWNPGMAALLAQKIIEVEEELVSNTTSLGINAQVNEIKGQSSHETIKKKIWFDIVRPTKDTKELKVLVGSKPEEKRERREEVITW